MSDLFTKDPEAILDYQWDWSAWLQETEAISEAEITADDGLTVDESASTDDTVTAWLSGGTAGTTYKVLCHIVTDQDREDDRTIYIKCSER